MTRKFAVAAFLTALCSGPYATAQDIAGATSGASSEPVGWISEGNRLAVKHSPVSLPQKFDRVALQRTNQSGGEQAGLDNIAQYKDDTGDILVTAYLYSPMFADAELAAFQTGRSILLSYRENSRHISRQVIPFGGNTHGMIVDRYEVGTTDPSPSLAGFASVDGWIVKLRISGSHGAQERVDRVFAEMVSQIQLAENTHVQDLAPTIGQRCTDPIDRGTARILANRTESDTTSILAMTLLVTADPIGSRGSGAIADGIAPLLDASASQACIEGEIAIGDARYPIFRHNGDSLVQLVVPLDDAGTVMMVSNTGLDIVPGYHVAILDKGNADILGTFETLPSIRQMRDILTGKDRKGGRLRARITRTASGELETTIFTQ